MGTRVTVAYEPREDCAGSAGRAFEVFKMMDARFSLFREDSEISAVNRGAGREIAVSDEFMDVLLAAMEMRSASGGAFDPFRLSPSVPSMEICHERSTVRLKAGAALDLNAVVKGRALDRALACFPAGVGAMIEAGGDLAMSRRSDGRPWSIGIRDPFSPRKIITVLRLHEGAVCTSGEYFRGRHLRRSSAAGEGFASLTVVAPRAETADMLGTAAFFMGEGAADFVERFGGECLSVSSDGYVAASPRMIARFRAALNLSCA